MFGLGVPFLVATVSTAISLCHHTEYQILPSVCISSILYKVILMKITCHWVKIPYPSLKGKFKNQLTKWGSADAHLQS